MKPIYILNGPNLNLVGEREPEVYGRVTLEGIETLTRNCATGLGLDIVFRQSNHEGVLVDWIQEARREASAIVLNAGAYTHTSVAILDALRATPVPAIEVHISNIFQREPFRHHSYVSAAARGVICGFGADSYRLAICAVASILDPGGSGGRGINA